MTDSKTTETPWKGPAIIGLMPCGYTLYRLNINGILSDVVAHLSATDDDTAWQEVAKLNGAKPTPSILRSLKTAYQIRPVYEMADV